MAIQRFRTGACLVCITLLPCAAHADARVHANAPAHAIRPPELHANAPAIPIRPVEKHAVTAYQSPSHGPLQGDPIPHQLRKGYTEEELRDVEHRETFFGGKGADVPDPSRGLTHETAGYVLTKNGKKIEEGKRVEINPADKPQIVRYMRNPPITLPWIYEQIESLKAYPNVKVDTLGNATDGSPIHAITIGESNYMLLVAGTHPDEKTSPVSVLEVLQRKARGEYKGTDKDIGIIAILPTNPTGYLTGGIGDWKNEHGHAQRENREGVNPNRKYSLDPAKQNHETKLIIDFLKTLKNSGKRFPLVLDIHGSWWVGEGRNAGEHGKHFADVSDDHSRAAAEAIFQHARIHPDRILSEHLPEHIQSVLNEVNGGKNNYVVKNGVPGVSWWSGEPTTLPDVASVLFGKDTASMTMEYPHTGHPREQKKDIVNMIEGGAKYAASKAKEHQNQQVAKEAAAHEAR